MRILIAYDTKRGSTERIARWMAEEIGEGAEVKRVQEVGSLEAYDLIVVGSPIYYERPLKSVVKFLKERGEEMEGRRVAVFVVCIADMFGHPGRGYARRRYLGSLLKLVRGEVVGGGVIRGWIAKENPATEDEVKRWIRGVVFNIGSR